MNRPFLSLQSIFFSYPSSVSPVLSDISLDLHGGWTGIVGANGSGKTTLLGISTGGLQPQAGSLHLPSSSLLCAQRTDSMPEGFDDFLYSGDGDAGRLISILEIGYDWPFRWDSLSHGERKRAQIGTALWKEPELLAVDEPTNHLDTRARSVLLEALKQYDGIGLLVSHDRDLLDMLCTRCVFLEAGQSVIRPGGISAGLQEEEREKKEALHKRECARQEVQRLEKEAEERRRLAESQMKRRSKRGLALKDHDARFRKNIARLTGKDGTGGRLLRQMDGRTRQARDRLDSTRSTGERKLGVRISGRTLHSDLIVSLEAGSVSLGPDVRLSFPPLAISPEDRIGISGPNGSGKSTLTRHLLERLWVPRKDVLYLPQEVPESRCEKLLAELKEEPAQRRGEILSRVSRLGSDPERLLQSRTLSPGETRKLLLARGMMDQPALIILDEPTNHLDLPSIRLLEGALSRAGCALLLISHDKVFLQSLTGIRWRTRRDSAGSPDYQLLISEADSL